MEWVPYALIALAAAGMEFIDSGLGMGYGTVLTPLMAACGFITLDVVPAVLLSQAVGGLVASIFHHREANVDFRPKALTWAAAREGWREAGLRGAVNRILTTDLKIVAAIILLGVIAAMAGSIVAVHVKPWVLSGYIAVMVTAIGVLLLIGRTFTFSWSRLMGVGFFASFNKGFTGGGFGPLATGGQVVVGNNARSSIGCTTLAEAPICIIAFITYAAQKGFGNVKLTVALAIGAAVGAVFGAVLTRKLPARAIRLVLGALLLVLGALGFYKLLHS